MIFPPVTFNPCLAKGLGVGKKKDGPIASEYKLAFATRLRDLRARARVTQDAAAEAIGIDRDRLAKYEAGKHEPPLWVLANIAEVYDVSLNFLVTGNERRTFLPRIRA